MQAVARNLFAVGRHRLRASHQRQLRSRALEACQQAAADIVVAFLSSPLTGAASDVAATAASYPEVVGGAVQHAQMRE